MRLYSTAFEQNGMIPSKYTCEGQDLSPPLNIDDIPPKAKSLAIILDDPDAPHGTFDHWIAWNLPIVEHLEEGATISKMGTNHFGQRRYRGPCPPRGSNHRYFFRIYALDIKLDLSEGSSKEDLLSAMREHIIAKAELIGTYRR